MGDIGYLLFTKQTRRGEIGDQGLYCTKNGFRTGFSVPAQTLFVYYGSFGLYRRALYVSLASFVFQIVLFSKEIDVLTTKEGKSTNYARRNAVVAEGSLL